MQMAEALLALANAKSQEVVQAIVADTWKYRHEGIPQAKKAQWREALSVTDEQLDQVRSMFQILS